MRQTHKNSHRKFEKNGLCQNCTNGALPCFFCGRSYWRARRMRQTHKNSHRKFEKNGLCQNCTNGALQAWSLLFSVAGPMEEQDTSDKRTKPAMLCHSCAGDMLYVIAKHTYTFGTFPVLQCSPRAHQRKPKTCQNMLGGGRCGNLCQCALLFQTTTKNNNATGEQTPCSAYVM